MPCLPLVPRHELHAIRRRSHKGYGIAFSNGPDPDALHPFIGQDRTTRSTCDRIEVRGTQAARAVFIRPSQDQLSENGDSAKKSRFIGHQVRLGG